MANYSIKELERLSGIKAHTLRIWEKRYAIFNPDRTDTNIRSYSDQDLKKLLIVGALYRSGLKISKITTLSDQDLTNQLMLLSQQSRDELTIFIDQFIISMIEFDEIKFEKQLSSCILRFGFERTILEIIYPFLEKVGLLWLSSTITPVQEHFISNLIRQKVIVAIDGLPYSHDKVPKKIVLFLPEGELHEIGLLFHHYIVKSLGFKTYYLGQSVPIADLQPIVNELKPDFLVTAIVQSPKISLQNLLNQLAHQFSGYSLLISGKLLHNFSYTIPKNVQIVKSATQFKKILFQI